MRVLPTLLFLVLAACVVTVCNGNVPQLQEYIEKQAELSQKLSNKTLLTQFENVQSEYLSNLFGGRSDATAQEAIAYVRKHANTSDVQSIMDLMHANSSLAAVLNFNTNCSKLNLSNAMCEAQCDLYVNWAALYKLLASNEALEASQYFGYYSYSGSPIEAYDSGNYDMCRYTYGTYCYTPVSLFQHACCIPGNCTGDDAEKVLKQSTCWSVWNGTYGSIVSGGPEVYCEAIPRHFDTGAIAVMLVFLLFLMLVCVTSVYKQLFEVEKIDVLFGNGVNDAHQRHADNSFIKTFVATFCIQDSWTNFISARKNKDYNFLDGIRWWSMCWVVLGHGFLFCLYMGNINVRATIYPSKIWREPRTDWTYDINEFYTTPALQGFFSVDSFFWLSGFLGLWSLLKMVRKYQKVRGGYAMIFPVSYVVRYLRLAPMMIYITLVTWKIADQLPEGPHVTQRDQNTIACQDNWYKVLFLYANLAQFTDSKSEDCMGQLWYVQCEFQMFIFLPIFAMLYHKSPKIGMIAALCAFLICCGIRIFEGYYYHFSANLIFPGLTVKNGGNQGTYSYEAPWTRMGTYWAGALGMMIFQSTYQRFRLTKSQYWIISSSAAFILCSLTFWPFGDVVDAPGTRWNVDQNIWYYALSRPGWGVGLSLLAYAMRFGARKDAEAAKKDVQDERYILIGREQMIADAARPGVSNGPYDEINDDENYVQQRGIEWDNYMLSKYLLSFELYQPLAKLTYCMYLVHIMIYEWYMYDLQTSLAYTAWEVLYFYIGTLVCAFVMSLVLWLVMERPLSNMVTLLIKALLGGGKDKRHSSGQQVKEAARQRDHNMSQVSSEYDKHAQFAQYGQYGQYGQQGQYRQYTQFEQPGQEAQGRDQKVALLDGSSAYNYLETRSSVQTAQSDSAGRNSRDVDVE